VKDVINGKDLDSFRVMVLRDKRAALNTYLTRSDSLFRANIIDSSTHQVIKSFVTENCIGDVNIDKFLLNRESIQVIDDCEFPHFIASMQPAYKLKYYFVKIKKILSPAFLKKMGTVSP
jgi:hypothetical protein